MLHSSGRAAGRDGRSPNRQNVGGGAEGFAGGRRGLLGLFGRFRVWPLVPDNPATVLEVGAGQRLVRVRPLTRK